MTHFSKLEEIRDRLEQLDNVSELAPPHELRSRLVKLREQRSILLGVSQSRARDELLEACDAGIMRHEHVLRRQQRMQGALADASPLSSQESPSHSDWSSVSSYGSVTSFPDSPNSSFPSSFQSFEQSFDRPKQPYPNGDFHRSKYSEQPLRRGDDKLRKPQEMFRQEQVVRRQEPSYSYPHTGRDERTYEHTTDHYYDGREPLSNHSHSTSANRGVSVERRRRELRLRNEGGPPRRHNLTEEERQVRERIVSGVRNELRQRMLSDNLFGEETRPELTARQAELAPEPSRSRSAYESVRSVSNASTASAMSSLSNSSGTTAVSNGSAASRSWSRAPRNGVEALNNGENGASTNNSNNHNNQKLHNNNNNNNAQSNGNTDGGRSRAAIPTPRFEDQDELKHNDDDSSVLHLHARSSTASSQGGVRPPPPILPEPRANPKWDPISEAHRYFELTHGMMLGIRTSVGKTQAKPCSTLFAHHFTESFANKFPAKPSCSARTPGHKMSDFWFKDYAPEVFRRIRKRFGLDCAAYLNGVCGNKQYLEFVSNSKSGEFFFFSHDEQFMIKTISHAEVKTLRALLPKYYQHIKANKDTLITRFFGLHRVEVDTIRSFGIVKKVYFLIMGSVFYTHPKRMIHLQFDLKGSLHGRSAGDNPGAILKDQDLLEKKIKIKVGKDNAAKLNIQIAKDVALLREMKIMDYSLLLGIHYPDTAAEDCKASARLSMRTARNSIRLVDHPLELQKFLFSEARGDFSGLQSPVGAPDLSAYTSERIVASAAAGANPDIIDPSEIVPATSCWTKNEGGFQSPELDPTNGTRPVYFMGIIDTLIQYGTLKKIETRYKAHKNDLWTLSAVDPVTYAERFKHFLADIIV